MVFDRADYGEKWMDYLARQLTEQGVSRGDRRELYRYRQFYLCYPLIGDLLPTSLQNVAMHSKNNCGATDSTIQTTAKKMAGVDNKHHVPE